MLWLLIIRDIFSINIGGSISIKQGARERAGLGSGGDSSDGVPPDAPEARIAVLEREFLEKCRQLEAAESALLEADERLHMLMSAIPDIVIFKDGKNRYLDANYPTLVFFGLEHVDYHGKGNLELAEFSPQSRAALNVCEDTDEVAWGLGKTSMIEEVMPRPDGTPRLLEVIKAPSFNPDGSRKQLVVFSRDVTDRKMAEKTLKKTLDELELIVRERTEELSRKNEDLKLEIVERERAEAALSISEDKYRNLVRQMSEGLLINDDQGLILDFNEAAARITGHDRERWIGRPLYEFIMEIAPVKIKTPEWTDQVNGGILSAFLGELFNWHGREIDVSIQRPDGELRSIRITTFVVKTHEGRIFGSLVRDITDRKRAEDELMSAKQKAELYLDLMGHDINNMHQVALGYLELAKDRPAGETMDDLLDKSIETLQRSAKLIDNVRKLQKLQDGVFPVRAIDLRKVLIAVGSDYEAMPGKTLRMNLGGTGECLVMANDFLYDVCVNLVNNAVKHTGDGTEITVGLGMAKDGDRRFWRVAVEDNGPGIPDDSKEKVFNRMHKGSARGMGLGLYLVRSLVDSYGGRIWAEDRVAGDRAMGARFIVLLPCVEKPSAGE